MQVVCCQFDIRWENKPANFQRVESLLETATLEPGGLVLLPEMFATGFTMNADAVAEGENGPTARFIATLAKRRHVHLLAGMVSRHVGCRPFNEAVLYGPSGERLGAYAKNHLFSYGDEHRHYTPGESSRFFQLPACTLQPTICYDLRFPGLFRPPAQTPAEVIAVIANWPAKRESHWLTLLAARAIENQAYVVAVNRVGVDPLTNYSGRSRIIDFQGEVIADAGGGEGVITATLDLAALRAWRDRFPALRDRRPLPHNSPSR